MLRRTALSALFLLTGDVAATALAGAGLPSLTAEAAAADFSGRIKRVKIKKKRVGSGFKLSARVESAKDATAASAKLTLSDASTGVELESLTVDDPVRARVFFSAPLAAGSSTDLSTYRVYPQLAENSDAETIFDPAGIELDEHGEAVAGPYKLRARVSAGGELQVSISNEDRGWDPGSITSLRVAGADGGPGWLSLDGIRHTLRADLSEGFVFEDNIMMKAILFDGDGAVLDTLQQTMAPPAADATPGFDRLSLKETKKGQPKLVTWTTSDGTAAALEVELTDRSSGETVLYTVDDSPMLTERTYVYTHLEFDPGETPAGQTYLCLIDLVDDSGLPVGEQYEVELVPPAVPEGEDHAFTTVPFADGQGSVGLLNTGDGTFHVVGALWSDDARQASSFNLIFEEPFEGPAPLETEVSVGLHGQLDKWVQKGEGTVPASYDLTTTLTTAEGAVLESLTVAGGGTGQVYSEGGGIVPGTVVSIGDKEVILNIGFKTEKGTQY